MQITCRSFTLVCTEQHADAVLREILTYLRDNPAEEKFVNMDKGAVQYVTRFQREQIDDVKKRFKVLIEPVTSGWISSMKHSIPHP